MISCLEEKEKYIKEAIFDYLEKVEMDNSILRGNILKKEEKEFIINNPNAFIIGLIADQSVKAELAWSLPYKLSKRLNTFDFSIILNTENIESLDKIIREKPSLHRYPNRIATYIYNAMKDIVTKYNNDASTIWKNQTAQEIVNRLEEFKGISHKKASLGTLILVRDMDIDILDKQNIDIAYDIHIRRLFTRLELVNEDTQDKVLAAAKRLYTDFPGKLTTAFWVLGRDICRPTNPLCDKCPLFDVCKKNL